MIFFLLWIAAGLVVLTCGAELLVRGAASLALRAGLSALMVGLTVVSFGTSSPELLVSLEAAFAGKGDIAVGNVVGSNIFNIAVTLALAAIICPVPVHRQIIRLDAPIALACAILVPLLLLNGTIGRVEGAVLFACLIAYTVMNYRLAKRPSAGNEPAEAEFEEVKKPKGHWALDVALVIGGLLLLTLGARLLVDNSISLARLLGISEAVIGLTIVAAGTSMPELATSIVAALRKQPDIAMGNVIGSNVFNVLAILGVTGLIVPFGAGDIGWLDYAVMVGVSALLIPLLYTGRILHRIEGALLLAIYLGYLYILWPKTA